MVIDYKSLFKKLSIYNWKLGIKLNVLVYVLLIVCFTVITAVGINFFRKQVEKSTFQKLEQLAYHKKVTFEKDYSAFLQDAERVFSIDLLGTIVQLKQSYIDYFNEDYDAFSPDTLAQSSMLLRDYYESEILGKINWNRPPTEQILPVRDIEIVLQRTYLIDNKWPSGEKDKLFTAKTGTSYDFNHQSIQAVFRSFARNYAVNNIYLVDEKTGDVYYNLNKNIALGTNLFTGPYKNSTMAQLYQQAIASTNEAGEIIFSDFTHFVPELNQAAAYIVKPLFLYGDKVSVAIIELQSDFFESMVYDKWMLQNASTIKLNILGADQLFRLHDLEQINGNSEYLARLEKLGLRNEELLKASQLGGGALVLGLTESVDHGTLGMKKVSDFFGDQYYTISLPLEIEGFEWYVVTQMSLVYQKKMIKAAQSKVILVYLLLLLMSTLALQGVIKSIISRLNILSNAFINLSKGQNNKALSSRWHDELGNTMEVFNKLNDRIKTAGEFAVSLGENKLETPFASDSDNDSLALALNTLREKLITNKSELEQRIREDAKHNWMNQGIAKFNDLLRQSNNDINNLAYIVIENLVEYLGANQGGVFLVEGDSESSRYIAQIAAYAYDRRKYLDQRIEVGEGLIGNCYLEKKSIHLKQLPDDYIEVRSGLGGAVPRTLYIAPLMKDKDVLGFVEIASFSDFEDYQVEFIEKLCESIAATFSTVKLNTRTAELLEESKRRAHEIAQQEEEMRQNLEEMQATQEELARLREEDERKQQKLLSQVDMANEMVQSLVDSIAGEVILKDSHGVVVLANAEACKRYNTSVDRVKGISDSELIDISLQDSEHELDRIALLEGVYIGYRSENVNGQLVEYIIEKKPFLLKQKTETGILTIWKKAERDSE
ncbi:MAG: GAF domain-containing protein [Bacteroidota bacterium]|nr:MAG: GAF domain-containing protein [Bacteroidota bacterium]